MSQDGKVMQPHQQRVVDEKRELDEKIDKLIGFLETEIFKTLPVDEQERLNRQAIIMGMYTEVLRERIEAF